MTQSFSKILIPIIAIILIVGGVFVWQYFSVPEEKIADMRIYANSQVGYQFEYPKTGLSLELDETVKTPTQNLVQFATEETTYGVRTYIGTAHETLEEWITDPGTAKASNALLDYNKITVGSESAYRYKDGLVVYVLNSGNLYQITAHQGIAPSQNSADPIYNHLLSTFRFLEVETVEEEMEPYIKILSPNGSEEWGEGKTHTIKWESSDVNKVNIEYGDGKSWHIELGYPAEVGEYSWTPEGIITQYEGFIGNDLTEVNIKIGIWDAENANIFDKSDNYFTLKEGTLIPSVTVTMLSPNREEVLEIGETYQIRWSCSDILPATSYIARLYLLLDEQTPHGTIDGTPRAYNEIPGCPSDGGKFLWEVGMAERGTVAMGSNYRVKVNILMVADGREQLVASDVSDNYFSIVE